MEMDSLPNDDKVTATAVNPTPLPLANLPQLAKSLNLGHQFFRVSFKHYKKLIRSNHCAALNVAALMDLLAILVYENNHYGMGTVEWKAAKSPSYYKSGDYVSRLKVDGADGYESLILSGDICGVWAMVMTMGGVGEEFLGWFVDLFWAFGLGKDFQWALLERPMYKRNVNLDCGLYRV
ncbi:hypothetical protein RJT34_12019 [Clitoria ternatea]|uniref:Dehydrogenase E1 component domain-containing protein n=1 Tax=Clitoria ternatea TaxID=43366 RepID=A0AAN9PK98_CLITE